MSSHPLSVTALGWSIATPASGISAPVVEAASFDELRRLGEKVKGKIVFFNKAMDLAIFEATFGHSSKRP